MAGGDETVGVGSAGGHPRQAWALLILAPVCAEYLAGYDDSTGDVAELVLGLLFLGPLYGGAALLVREIARRAALGWRGMAWLAAAFGVVQAGVVDQSLFSAGYRDIADWDDWRRHTFVPALGLSVYLAQLFVIGHVVYSVCAPIALVESCRPATRCSPWLGRGGLIGVAAIYGVMSVVILVQHLATESSHASPAQVAGALAVAVGLAVAALRTPRATARADGVAPAPWVLALGSFVAAAVLVAVPETWPGVAMAIAIAAAAAAFLHRVGRRATWRTPHTLAVAAGALAARGALAFTYAPVVGDVAPLPKLLHNAFFLALVLAVWGYAASRSDDDECRHRPGPDATRPGT